MILNYVLRFGTFVSRPNRFIAHINVDGEIVVSHIPNTGRLKELLFPGAFVILSYHPSKSRKTQYELRMVKKNDCWVSIDSQLPNSLAYEAIHNGVIKELAGYTNIKREVTYKNSRFDLQLTKALPSDSNGKHNGCTENAGRRDNTCFVEVKGVTLEREGWSYFPDAPTERGRKHIDELIHAVKEGYRAALLFVVQMEQVTGFSPNTATDSDFAEKVKEAVAAGVDVLPYRCVVTPNEVKITDKLSFIC